MPSPAERKCQQERERVAAYERRPNADLKLHPGGIMFGEHNPRHTAYEQAKAAGWFNQVHGPINDAMTKRDKIEAMANDPRGDAATREVAKAMVAKMKKGDHLGEV